MTGVEAEPQVKTIGGDLISGSVERYMLTSDIVLDSNTQKPANCRPAKVMFDR